MTRLSHTARPLGWIALVLLLAFAQPATADAGPRTRERTPVELWKTYPLDPSQGKMHIRGSAGTGGADVSPPGSADAPGAQRGAGDAPEPSSVGDRSSRPFAAPWWGWLAVAVLLGVLGLLLIRMRFPAVRAWFAELATSPIRSLASVSGPKIPRPPPRSTTRLLPFRPATKGATMVNFRRRPEPPDRPDAVAGISRYSLKENVDEREDVGEASGEDVGMEEAKAAAEPEGAEVAAVGEEIRTVLVSAQDAAEKIRRRAEEEAERFRNEAASAAAADVAEAQRIAAASRVEADRIRTEAESYATDVRAEADAAAAQRRIEAEGEAAQILEEAQRRRDLVHAEIAHKGEHIEAEARQRVETLQSEIELQEERLDSILVVLQGMSSQLAALLGQEETSDDLADALGNMTAKR